MIKKTVLGGALALFASSAFATNISFSGNFGADDDVQLFNFTTDGTSTVYAVSYGYAGGTQADGSVISAGGLDTILTLFDSTGALITYNDDGSSACFSAASAVAGSSGFADPTTGMVYDTCFSQTLAAGDYIMAVTQYNNFAAGSLLTDGFIEDGDANFTSVWGCSAGQFCDVNADNRTSFWAYDILNVVSADIVNNVPTPATLALFGLGLAGMSSLRRKPKA